MPIRTGMLKGWAAVVFHERWPLSEGVVLGIGADVVVSFRAREEEAAGSEGYNDDVGDDI